MLRVQLHINREQIGDYEVRNVTDPRLITPEGLCKYEVRAINDDWLVDSPPLFTVRHRRIDGAQALAAKVLRKAASREGVR